MSGLRHTGQLLRNTVQLVKGENLVHDFTTLDCPLTEHFLLGGVQDHEHTVISVFLSKENDHFEVKNLEIGTDEFCSNFVLKVDAIFNFLLIFHLPLTLY